MKKLSLVGITVLVLLACNKDSFSQTKEVLTNENIIQLTKIGLDPTVIVLKIKNSQTKFDVSTDKLVELTKYKVSAEVVSEMIKASSTVTNLGTTSSNNTNAGKISSNNSDIGTGTTSSTSSNPSEMRPAGIYYYNAAGVKLIKKVDAVPCSYQSGGGGYGGFGGGSTSAVISGEKSKLTISERLPVFYFYFNSGNSNNSDWFASTSPNEFSLVKFDVKKGKRLFKVASHSSGGFSSSSNEGIPEKFKLPFEYEQVAEGIYKVTFKKSMDYGEYCFVMETNSSKVFDFSIQK